VNSGPHRADVVWSVPERPARPGPALLVLPHAGGNAHSYSPWREFLADDVRLLLGQYPGRGARFIEPLPNSMQDLVGPILDSLPPGTDELVVLGHSMGSLVAFEVARQLTAAHRPPQRLIVSACRAPHLRSLRPVHPQTLSDDQLVAVVQARGGTDSAVLDDEELRAIVLPSLRADFTIDAAYCYAGEPQPLTCPITVLGGDSDQVVPPQALHEWASASSGPVQMVTFPGGHFYWQQQLAAVMAVVSVAIADTAPQPVQPTASTGSIQ